MKSNVEVLGDISSGLKSVFKATQEFMIKSAYIEGKAFVTAKRNLALAFNTYKLTTILPTADDLASLQTQDKAAAQELLAFIGSLPNLEERTHLTNIMDGSWLGSFRARLAPIALKRLEISRAQVLNSANCLYAAAQENATLDWLKSATDELAESAKQHRAIYSDTAYCLTESEKSKFSSFWQATQGFTADKPNFLSVLNGTWFQSVLSTTEQLAAAERHLVNAAINLRKAKQLGELLQSSDDADAEAQLKAARIKLTEAIEQYRATYDANIKNLNGHAHTSALAVHSWAKPVYNKQHGAYLTVENGTWFGQVVVKKYLLIPNNIREKDFERLATPLLSRSTRLQVTQLSKPAPIPRRIERGICSNDKFWAHNILIVS